MGKDNNTRKQNDGELSRDDRKLIKLQKQLAQLRDEFTAGTLTSEVYLRKKKVVEKEITDLHKKIRGTATKNREKQKQQKSAALKKNERENQLKNAAAQQKMESEKKGTSMNSTGKLIGSIAAIVIIIGATIWGLISLIGGVSTGYDAGMKAPNFSFQTVGGSKASLSDYRGKQVIVTFWDRAESCADEAPLLKEATESLSSQKTLALIVNGGADSVLTAGCIKKQGIAVPVLPDPRREITRLYGVNEIPKTVFINEKGIIAHVRFGSLDGGGDIEGVYAKSSTQPVKKNPVIANAAVTSLTHDSAVITWTSSIPGSSSVMVSDGKQMRILNDPAITRSHMAAYANLSAGTVYNIKITTKDVKGNEYSSEGYSLRTLPDTAPPVIQDVKTSYIEATGMTVIWATDEAATGQVEFGETEAMGGTTVLESMLTTSHSISINGLKPGTKYYLRVKSKDANGNESSFDMAPVTTKSAPAEGIKIGMPAPDFTLMGIDGNDVQLSRLKGSIVLLQFFNTDCRSCVAEMPLIRKVFNEWKDKGLLLFSITKETHIANLQTFANIYQLTFPILMDPGEKLVDEYRIPFTPYFIFIDRDGIVRDINEGRFAGEYALTEALNNMYYPDSAVPKTPAAP